MSVAELIEGHRSIRRFKPDPVPEKDLEAILEASRRSPSAWNLQPITISVVRDKELKGRLANLLGDPKHVREAPLLLVYSLDLAKVLKAAEISGGKPVKPSLALMVSGVIAVGAAMAWSTLVAESLGYGVSYTAIYKNSCGVAEQLGLPELVLPLAGLLIGRPAENPSPRPRQPMGALVAENDSYGSVEERARAYMSVSSDFPELLRKSVVEGAYFDSIAESFEECARSRGLLG